MTLDDLLDDHRAQLGKCAARFASDDDLARHLRNAADRLSGKCPRWASAGIALTAGVADYAAPADLYGGPTTDWGRYPARQPWDDDFLGYPPRLLMVYVADALKIRLIPEPTAAQLTAWGSTLTYRYLTRHRIDDDVVTFTELQRALVLLAALVEAMRDLAADTTVVQLQKGLAGLPTAGTPAYLYEKLLLELERA